MKIEILRDGGMMDGFRLFLDAADREMLFKSHKAGVLSDGREVGAIASRMIFRAGLVHPSDEEYDFVYRAVCRVVGLYPGVEVSEVTVLA